MITSYQRRIVQRERKRLRRPPKACVVVPCPSFQKMTLDIESVYNPITGAWDPISELPILDLGEYLP